MREGEISKGKSLEQIKAEMEAKGFQYAGWESLTTFCFTKDARFKTRSVRTRADVIKEYEEKCKAKGFSAKVELVEEEGLSQGQEAVLVFVKVEKVEEH